jgi:uncharacterized protein (TIGR02145 family)
MRKTMKIFKTGVTAFVLSGIICVPSFSQTLKTVLIGDQVWMAENLNVSAFRNGDPIPEAKSAKEWEEAGKKGLPAWCCYESDRGNGEKYGKLYNFYKE